MGGRGEPRIHDRWAQLRFSVVGQLLAAPPPTGELRSELEKLAAREWRHPASGEPVRFAISTIQRCLPSSGSYLLPGSTATFS
jgi:putative transposase